MKRGLPLLAVSIVVVVVGIGIVHWANRPSSTQHSNVGNTTDSGVLASNSDLAPFASTYFSTQLPADMQLKTSNDNPRGAIRATYLFTNTKASPSDQVAITIGTMGLARLSEVAGVKQRLNDPAVYQVVSVSNTPQGAISFKRNDVYETAVFWQQDNLYVAVVVSGSSVHHADLDQAVQTILTNWSWH